MRPRPLVASFLAVATFASALAQQAAAPITLGSPAPPISVKTWLKGTPVTGFDPAKTYVVEFWATWCGPCIQSIPHVTKLAKENPDVTFLGVGIWEDEQGDNLTSFVKKMGDKMGYNVGYSGNKDGMAATWMDAAGQNGIPTAFVIKEGKVAWVGHPMSLDAPLASIKAGTYDMAAAKAKFDADAEKARKERETYLAFNAIGEQYNAGKKTEAKAALTAFVAANPDMKAQADMMTFDWLATENPTAWEAKAKTLAASKDENDAAMVLQFAMQKSGAPATAPLARKAIGMALKAKPDDFNTLMYAQYVYKNTGDHALALKTTNRLLALLPTSRLKDSAEYKAVLL
ncbi:redoxin domain-containing protein, partial [bacterium]